MPLVGEKRVIGERHKVLTERFIGCYDDVVLEKVGNKSLSRSTMIGDGGYAVG